MPKNWRGRLPIPHSVSPLVRKLFGILNDRHMTILDLGEAAGLNPRTISSWRYNREPTLGNFEAALNAAGYNLAIIPSEFSIDEATKKETYLNIRGPEGSLGLSPSQNRFLLCVMGNALATQELLIDAIWPNPDEMPETAPDVIRVMAVRIRRKLSGTRWRLHNDHGQGYRLIEVRAVSEEIAA